MNVLQKRFVQAIIHELPKDFNEWTLRGDPSLKFPESLKETSLNHQLKYRLAWIDYTRNDWSIAHVAAMFGFIFPEEFAYWTLKTKQGNTLAHVVAKYQEKIYPSLYGLQNDFGQTVFNVIQTGILTNNHYGD